MIAEEVQNYLAGYYLMLSSESGVVETDVEIFYPRGYRLQNSEKEQ